MQVRPLWGRPFGQVVPYSSQNACVAIVNILIKNKNKTVTQCNPPPNEESNKQPWPSSDGILFGEWSDHLHNGGRIRACQKYYRQLKHNMKQRI
jgi:hypothetical protein